MDYLWVLSNASALFLLWLFVAAGSHKLLSSQRGYYEVVFTAYGIESPFAAKHLPIVVGLVEVMVGMALVIPALRGWGSVAALSILFFYFLLVGVQLLRGKADMDCGCAGPDGETKISAHLLVRNLVLMALAVLCLLSIGDAGVMPWVMSVLTALVLILVYLSCGQLIATAQKIKQLEG